MGMPVPVWWDRIAVALASGGCELESQWCHSHLLIWVQENKIGCSQGERGGILYQAQLCWLIVGIYELIHGVWDISDCPQRKRDSLHPPWVVAVVWWRSYLMAGNWPRLNKGECLLKIQKESKIPSRCMIIFKNIWIQQPQLLKP